MPRAEVKKLTLKDLAKILGVSTATISNAFNRPDQLSAKLRDKILTECEQLGYTGPNIAARALRTGETGIVGVMLSDPLRYNFNDAVAHGFLSGLAEVFDEQHVSMLLLSSKEAPYHKPSIEAVPDYFIVYGEPRNATVLERLERQHKKIVTVDFDYRDYPSVNIDNFQGAFDIAQYGVKQSEDCRVAILGLRLIDEPLLANIAGKPLLDASRSISSRRLDGYLAALQQAGMIITPEQIWSIPVNEAEISYEAARQVLSAETKPNLLLCMSDRVALAAIKAAADLGIAIPSELRVAGFDDIPEATVCHPGLTTVHQPFVEKGRVTANLLLPGLAPIEQKRVLPIEVVKRESC
ncbi:LacI family DNA-binding transcriptional regulator [Endozoicomonas sp. SM1973]|uniref:LacI family DNA-binding transcriptional regulator n=1 Tax=Spartinivicinus marinus TaxID=2994442 RepID=A0A853IDG9_9GAMM|nr:LacI family DNA-binding transcriptional regulator [Spartinivicinus marinus]MCX4025909.1 LacI family DNA-binding transcriptional regulator [Spartinivicinus marinus]NYZ68094.1 LacI family DNA-binding transcriptional regulator [Spartinivicinus marinus]